jgi:phosphorylcholine metabolism protein LicD
MTSLYAAENLLALRKTLGRIGVIFSLEAGTLLLAVRDNKVSQDDLDVRVSKENFERIKHNLLELFKGGFSVVHIYEGPSGQSPEITLMRKGETIDIFTYETRGDQAWWLSYDNWSGGPEFIPHHVPLKHFEHLEPFKFLEETWLIPSDVEEYLTLAYGDWRTPVEKWDYTKDPKCIDWNWRLDGDN